MQLAMQDQQVQMQKEQLASQLEVQRQQFDEYIKQQELALRQQELQIKATAEEHNLLKIQADVQAQSVKADIAVEKNRMDSMMELQRQQLDKMAMQLSETEKLMEERRLASELAIEKMRLAMDQIKTSPTAKTSSGTEGQKPIVINNIIPKPTKKVGRIGTDEQGNTTISIDHLPDETA